MSDLKEMAITSTPEEKQSFSFSKENNGVTKTVRGEEVENGWVITIEKEWTRISDDGDKHWEHESKRFVTTKDPRESAEKKEEDNTSAISNLINDIAGDSGMLIV